MNYVKHYIKLMRKATARDAVGQYHEKHHIFPQSIFGTNSNTVMLTGREHYIAHMLLWKACKKRYGVNHTYTKKMHFALNMMTWTVAGRKLQSRNFAIARAAARVYNGGDNNPSKRPEVREKIRQSKIGRERPDMKGRRFFGAAQDKVDALIESNARKRTGTKINYPKNRNSPPCSNDKRTKISAARQKTKEKFQAMTEDEFQQWIALHSGPTKSGRKNTNVTRAIKWRNNMI